MPISWKEEKRRRDNNLCVGCGAELPDTKYKNCEECRRKRRERDRKTREHKKIAYNEQGKCWRCSYPLDEDGKCKRCYNNTKNQLERAKERGLCIQCKKNKPLTGYTRCEDCLKIHNQKQREYYKKRKEKGLCYTCCKKTENGKVYCEECSRKQHKYAKDTREFMLKIGICPICRQESIMGEEKSCPECKAKRVNDYPKYKRNWTDEQKKNMRESVKKLRDDRRENNVCVICGKRKPNEGYVTCGYCLAKNREADRLKRQKQPNYLSQEYRRQDGICFLCGKQIDKNEKSCPDCKKTIAERLLKARGYIVEGENQ